MVPREVLRSHDHKPMLRFFVDFVSLFSEIPAFYNAIRVLNQLVAYLLDNESLLCLEGNQVLTFKILRYQNVIQQLICFNFGILIEARGILLNKLDHQMMQPFLLTSVQHYLIDGFSKEAFSESADRVFRICFIKDFNEVFLLKDFKNLVNGFARFVSEG
jgi:hypothetical protein